MNTLASDYPLAKQLLLLTGTHGDGSAPASANHFPARLERFKAQPVLQFAVLGFGDRSFPFCRFAVAVDAALRTKAVAAVFTLREICVGAFSPDSCQQKQGHRR